MTITLYFLQASRCIRTAWQLEELGLDYDVEFSERVGGIKAPPEFIAKTGDSQGKFPLIRDGDLIVGESGAIAEYLCEKYDPTHRLLPVDPARRVAALRWVHAAEGMFVLHGIAIMYVRGFGAASFPDAAASMEEKMSVNVVRDFDYLESELGKSSGKFLLGDEVTVADCMMIFSVQFILLKQLGVKGKKYERVEKWLKDCEETETYKKAVEKTGYRL